MCKGLNYFSPNNLKFIIFEEAFWIHIYNMYCPMQISLQIINQSKYYIFIVSKSVCIAGSHLLRGNMMRLLELET